MTSFVQGAPLPDITQKETRTDIAPDYYTNYLQDLSTAGQTAIGKTAAEGIAAYDPLQTEGYGMVSDASTAYQPGLTAAGKTAEGVAGGIDLTRIGALMDPYQKQVVDEMARLQQQNIQRSVMPTLQGAFVGRGDLGSQRYAAATGQTMADMQRNLMGQQYGALSSGYQNALKAALDEMNLQNQAAQTQAKIAEQEQALGLKGAEALTKAGAEKQAYEQAKLDYPLKQATSAAALMRGFQIPTTQTSEFVGPKAGLYQTSPLANIIGVLGTLGAIKGGSSGDKLIGSLTGGLSKLFSGSEKGGGEDYSWLNDWINSGGGGIFEGSGYDFSNEDFGALAKGGLVHIERK